MPPRQRPRNWLASRLRSAAGAVERLAGRVEPVGQPRQEPPSDPPRRFGEPPQHWLDVVATHAPGLLRDLDLDLPAAEPAQGRDDPADGFGDRIGQDGPGRRTAVTRPVRPVEQSAGRAAGTVGRAPGTGGGLGHATSGRGPDLAAHSDGRGRPASATPDTVGDDGMVDAAYGVDGPEAVSGGAKPDGLPSMGGTGRSEDASSAADRSGSPGIGGVSPRGSSDASDGATTAEVPLTSNADRRPPGRPLDGWRQRGPSRPIPATGPAQDHATAADTRGLPRIAEPPTPPTEILEEFGPSRGSYLPRSTADSADIGGARPSRAAARDGRSGGAEASTGWASAPRSTSSAHSSAAAEDGGPERGGGLWPALPDDRARSGQQVGERVGRPTGHRNGQAVRTADVAWIGSAHHDPGGGRLPERRVIQADATAFGPWPALPDDRAVWAVPGDVLDTAHLGRLDREQAGD
ncbi:hypothetical protein ACIOBK_25825 [Micromonospora chokoriensis]